MKTHRIAASNAKYLLVALLVVGSALVMASCATTPKPVPKSSAPAAAPKSSTSATQPAAPEQELKKAKSLKGQIAKYNLGPRVPGAYRQGSAALAAGEQKIGSDNAAAKRELDTAIVDFQKVLDTGLPLAVKQEGEVVAKEKAAADALKAKQVDPADYDQAQQFVQQANARQKAADLGGAYSLLEKAASGFRQAASVAKKQREAALVALRKANSEIDQAKSQVETIQKNLESALSRDNGNSQGNQQNQTGAGGQ